MAQLQQAPTPTPGVTDSKHPDSPDPVSDYKIKENPVGLDARTAELVRVLGMDEKAAKTLSSKEIRQKYIDNAEKLGVIVYQVTEDNV